MVEDHRDIRTREQYWIDRLSARLGWGSLYNVAPKAGQPGGVPATPEFRRRLSERNTRRYADPRARQAQAEATRRYWQSDTYRRRVVEGIRAFARTPEGKRIASERGKRTWQIPEAREKLRAAISRARKGRADRAKVWEGFVAPDGTTYRDVHNLAAFCREHGLAQSAMILVDQQRITHYKSWTRVGGLPAKKVQRTYKGFVAPDGTIYTDVMPLAAFCKRHGLDPTQMCNLDAGRVKTYKGWMKLEGYDPDSRRSFGPFVSPNGTIYRDIRNLAAFCREQALSRASMGRLHQGAIAQFKGWRRLAEVPGPQAMRGRPAQAAPWQGTAPTGRWPFPSSPDCYESVGPAVGGRRRQAAGEVLLVALIEVQGTSHYRRAMPALPWRDPRTELAASSAPACQPLDAAYIPPIQQLVREL